MYFLTLTGHTVYQKNFANYIRSNKIQKEIVNGEEKTKVYIYLTKLFSGHQKGKYPINMSCNILLIGLNKVNKDFACVRTLLVFLLKFDGAVCELLKETWQNFSQTRHWYRNKCRVSVATVALWSVTVYWAFRPLLALIAYLSVFCN